MSTSDTPRQSHTAVELENIKYWLEKHKASWSVGNHLHLFLQLCLFEKLSGVELQRELMCDRRWRFSLCGSARRTLRAQRATGGGRAFCTKAQMMMISSKQVILIQCVRCVALSAEDICSPHGWYRDILIHIVLVQPNGKLQNSRSQVIRESQPH